MLSLNQINNINLNKSTQKAEAINGSATCPILTGEQEVNKYSSSNLQAYHPSFTSLFDKIQLPRGQKKQYNIINSLLDKESKIALKSLYTKGILVNNNSNDGSTVLDNLYKIATKKRIQGLSPSILLKETIGALDNPFTITQKFGDISEDIANEITATTGQRIPTTARNVVSSTCTVASMEYTLASKMPAEFTRFVAGLSSENYSVDKMVKMTDIADGLASGMWMLKEFNTDNKIQPNLDDVLIKIKPDRNAIVRARVQSTYKDANERSCVDVLIQSALINLGSQHTYDSLTDERTGKFNPDKNGLTDFEKNFVEEVIFGTPKISVVYQNIDEDGNLVGYNCEPDETKQHILKSLELGNNVIIGYTHLNDENKVQGGHEITVIGYEQDNQGNGYFICNDTDDDVSEPIKVEEKNLLRLLHHAGIAKEALNEQDEVIPSWKEVLNILKHQMLGAS